MYVLARGRWFDIVSFSHKGRRPSDPVMILRDQQGNLSFPNCQLQKSFKLVNARLRNQVKAGSFGAGGLVPDLVHDAEKQLSKWKVRRLRSIRVNTMFDEIRCLELRDRCCCSCFNREAC